VSTPWVAIPNQRCRCGLIATLDVDATFAPANIHDGRVQQAIFVCPSGDELRMPFAEAISGSGRIDLGG
jgi:hypothetical protein